MHIDAVHDDDEVDEKLLYHQIVEQHFLNPVLMYVYEQDDADDYEEQMLVLHDEIDEQLAFYDDV